LGFDNEAVLVLLGELSRGVIDVARFTYDRLGKLVARRRGNATQLRRT
jgi:hypothetical protein